MLDSQDAALDRLNARDFATTLLRFVEEIGRRPPRPAPEISWDFWTQFDQFERLEELRQFRPALYRALPTDPGVGAGNSRTPESPVPSPEPRVPSPESRAPSPEPRAPSPDRR